MDEKSAKKDLNLRLTLILPIIIFSVVLIDSSLGLGLVPRLVTRFCYNSANPQQVNSQCVLCNYYLFDATLLGCTGSTALTFNITAQQAFCVISQCLGQIRQSPMFLGRKKRSEDINDFINDSDKSKIIDKSSNDFIEDNHLWNEESSEDTDSQSIYKYNSNEHFIVAKEVEALIIDMPDPIDESVYPI